MSENGKRNVDATATDLARRPYAVEIVHETVEGYDAWFARVPDLPGCMTQADTLAELEAMIEDAKFAWVATALEDGIPIPEPQGSDGTSGKFLVRAPKSLHRQVAEAAARDGVSLNAWVNVVLARAVGAPQRVAPEAAAPPKQKPSRAKAAKAEAVAAD